MNPQPFKIYSFCCHYPYRKKEGFLLQNREGFWTEVSPIKGRNQETITDVFLQLKALQRGEIQSLYPSVAFGLHAFNRPLSELSQSWPICLLLEGTVEEIKQQAIKSLHYSQAKVKIGNFSLQEAIALIQQLKSIFRLRIDIEEKWNYPMVQEFCSYFSPNDFEYIEDPGIDVSPFPMASDIHPSYKYQRVWKPMVWGIPPLKAPVILSSVYETGVGIAQIAYLAEKQKIPMHALGVGTYLFLQEDILKEPLIFDQGKLILPSSLSPKMDKLNLC